MKSIGTAVWAALALGMAWGAAAEEAVRDLVIYGGSPAAVTAAVKAKRTGLSVALVSPDRHVGGLTVSGLGFTDAGNTSAIGGLALDFYRRVYREYLRPDTWRWQRREAFDAEGQDTKAMRDEDGTMWTFEPHVAQRVIDAWLAEADVETVRGARLFRGADGKSRDGVTMKDGRIASFRTEDGRTWAARYFIDATYEGDLMAAAGVRYAVGRESNATYGERWNGNHPGVRHHEHSFKKRVSAYRTPGDRASGLCAETENAGAGERGTGDGRVQAYCYRLCMTDHAENRIPFAAPAGYDRTRYELLARVYAAGYDETFRKFDRIPNLKTDTNNHGPFNADMLGANYDWPEASYARRDELARAHRDYQAGLFYFIANDPSVPEDVRRAMSKWGLARDEFTDNGGWPYHLYVREARRMLGEYVMTEHDCLGETPHAAQGRRFGPIGMGSYCIDSHNVRRYVTEDGCVQNEGDVGVHPKKPYAIDYGAILPKRTECRNLLVPVAVSASHSAFGSIRMEPVFMILGESAATAVALASRTDAAVQDIDAKALAERLKADGQVLR